MIALAFAAGFVLAAVLATRDLRRAEIAALNSDSAHLSARALLTRNATRGLRREDGFMRAARLLPMPMQEEYARALLTVGIRFDPHASTFRLADPTLRDEAPPPGEPKC